MDGESGETLWFASMQGEGRVFMMRVKPLHVRVSKYQRIEVYESKYYGRILTLNGEIQLASRFNAYIHESMVHPALLTHPNPRRVLIVGGGDGGSTAETLKHGVESVTVVEIDEEVVKVAREFFPEISSGFSDPRVKLVFEDGRRFLEECSQRFDVIINDMSDPVGPAKSVFTEEFFRLVCEHLEEDGVFATHVESPDTCEEFFYRALATLKTVFPLVRPYRVWIPPYAEYWGRAVASKRYDPLKLSAKELETRITERNVELMWLTPELCVALFHSLSKDILEKTNLEWKPLRDGDFPEFRRE
ncbi:MAG: polyamine aminopropyltransferase [Candidatus Freyarchaeota archaeon]|nr:polyamine aminopropyltransferase [Candidatus Jordarchaeia archaeon]